ncbi:unnamed protein product [Ectocarpus sp. CCAP 1310/34]|nr:unnamed protein product [Ectocarpus sp. CCAP 1310/34]
MNMLRFLPGKKRPLQQQRTPAGAPGNHEQAQGAPAAMTLEQQLRLPPNQTEAREDGDEGEEEEEEEIREERQHTIDLQRSSRGLSNADEMALVQQRELRIQRNLSLPERHPRSSSSSQEYGVTDHEEDDDDGERSDRSDSIEVRRTDAHHFAVCGINPDQAARGGGECTPQGMPRRQGFKFGNGRRLSL